MEKFLLPFLFSLSFFCHVCSAQGVVSGTVRDAESGEPLGYATIGVVGTSAGCVADRDGRFEIAIPDTMPGSEQLRISLISYEPVVISVADFLALVTHDFRLVPKPALLKELVVKPAKVKRRTLGSDYSRTGMYTGFTEDMRGFEIGVLFKLKKSVLLERVSIAVGSCTYDMMTFRINVYRRLAKNRYENILTEPVYGYCPETSRPVYVDIDLYDRNIVLEGDILVTIQHIQDQGSGSIWFPTGLFIGDTTLQRESVESLWDEDDQDQTKFPLNITVLELSR